jgi:hypothetical protein
VTEAAMREENEVSASGIAVPKHKLVHKTEVAVLVKDLLGRVSPFCNSPDRS